MLTGIPFHHSLQTTRPSPQAPRTGWHLSLKSPAPPKYYHPERNKPKALCVCVSKNPANLQLLPLQIQNNWNPHHLRFGGAAQGERSNKSTVDYGAY